MNTFRVLPLAILVSAFLAGCSDSIMSDPAGDPGAGGVPPDPFDPWSEDNRELTVDEPIDSVLRLLPFEHLSIDGRSLELGVTTTRDYPCVTYPIVYALRVAPDGVTVEVDGVHKSEGCWTAVGPAAADLDFRSLPRGDYPFTIRVADTETTGRLSVTPDSYRFTDLDGPHSLVTIPVLHRVPDDTIWGLVGYHLASTAPLAQAFLADLEGAGAERTQLVSGSYGHFEIDEEGYVVPPDFSGHHFTLVFAYHFPGNFEEVRNVVRSYARDWQSELAIRVLGWEGDIVRSWTVLGRND